ncbi:DEAD/DEAH box helicase family protein [bacterium]|nr:DEAD/DEAH box helicase family protein [bacterium]
MTETLIVSKFNDVYVTVDCDASVAMELKDYFTFKVPGYRFMPAYRNKVWSGDIHLFNPMSKRIYFGLIPYVNKFCESRGYQVVFDKSVDGFASVDENSIVEFITDLNLPFKPRGYQLEAFIHAIRTKRSLLVSPTASGKSLIIYMVTKWWQRIDFKTLIIVPTISLVEQMKGDFVSYGGDGNDIHTIMSGREKHTDKPIVISTWQSIYKMPRQWYEQFDVVIGDEAHQYKAKSLTSVLEKMTKCPIRIGFTGTLDGTQTHKLVLEGLFGAVKKVTTTAELIEQKHLADFKIQAIVLKHTDANKKEYSRCDYHDEIDFLVRNEARNNFITQLSLHLKGNTLILFQFVEKHGKPLHEMLTKQNKEQRHIFFVSGEVEVEDRELVRKITEKEDNAIIVASYGTFSTGINIRNLHNVVFASPTKSRIRSLQSIGRALRRGDNKEQATLYDIADDLSWKKSKNHTLKHFVERVGIYTSEKFEYKITSYQLR